MSKQENLARKLEPDSAPVVANDTSSLAVMSAQSTIMMVDDEPIILETLQMFLEDAGYDNFITTTEPKKALNMVVLKKPDVVLLDVMMPKRNGYDVCQSIRGNPDWHDVRIIMLTAKGRDVEVEKGLALGADDYITKPFSTREVVARVRDLIEGVED